MNKTCTKCGETKPRTEFWRNESSADSYRSECKTCRSGRNNELVRIRRRRNAKKVKAAAVEHLGGECMICGLRDDPIVFDFDHRDPITKSFSVSRFIGNMNRRKDPMRFWPELQKELDKCDLLCAHCHRKKTYLAEDHGVLVRLGQLGVLRDGD